MYDDELADYLEGFVKIDERLDEEVAEWMESDPAAQDAEEMEYDDWREHWMVVEGELVTR